MISRKFSLILFSPLLLLLIPAVAMLFTAEVSWSALDFTVGGILLLGLGLVFALFSRQKRRNAKIVSVYALITLGIFLIWLELAVGIFGSPFAGT